jgi:uncharacterized membrane protein
MTVIDAVPTKPKRPARPPNLQPYKRTAMVVGVAAAALVAAVTASEPRWDLLAQESGAVKAHLAAAVGAFTLGGVILLARKGRALHITLGWIWVSLMAITAFVSLFITGLNGNWWSWIHILSGATLLALPFAVMAARKRNIVSHRWQMLNLYLGGMIIAGGFTFIPGRLMWNVFFG